MVYPSTAASDKVEDLKLRFGPGSLSVTLQDRSGAVLLEVRPVEQSWYPAGREGF